MQEYDETEDFYEDEENPYASPQQQSGNLLKDLRKQLSAKAKREKELAEELTTLKGQLREKSITDVLTAKGVNPQVAKLIPPTVTAPDQVEGWLAEYGELFTPTAQAGQTAEPPAPPQPSPDEQALGRIAAATAGAQSPGTREQEQLAKLRDPNLSYSELLSLIAGGGA